MSSLDAGWFRLITNILIQSRDLAMVARWHQCGTMMSQMLARASFSAVCLTVFPFEFRPRTFTIGFYEKNSIMSELMILECSFPLNETAVKKECLFYKWWFVWFLQLVNWMEHHAPTSAKRSIVEMLSATPCRVWLTKSMRMRDVITLFACCNSSHPLLMFQTHTVEAVRTFPVSNDSFVRFHSYCLFVENTQSKCREIEEFHHAWEQAVLVWVFDWKPIDYDIVSG